MTERWADIPDYPKYQVSDHGRVWSFNKRKNGVMETNPNNCGYAQITLCKDNTKSQRLVHRLVGLAFLGECPAEGYTIDHIDRNKLNNHYTNLRWASKSDQSSNNNGWGQFPHKHITTGNKKDRNGNLRVLYRIAINIPDKKFSQFCSKKKWTYDQVVERRNEIYASLGIERVD